MEPEASELPKGLVLGRDENIHIRITPMGDVGSHSCHWDLNSYVHFKLSIFRVVSKEIFEMPIATS